MLPLLPIALALIAGILVGNATHLPLTTWICANCVTLAAAFLLRRRGGIQHGAILLATALFGAALVTLTRSRQQLSLPTDRPVTYRAIVLTEPVRHGRVITCDMAIIQTEGHPLRRPTLVKASILRDTTLNRWRTLHMGSGITACSLMEPPRNRPSATRFNYVRWMHVHGFAARTFVLSYSWQPCAVSPAVLPRWQRLRFKAMELRGHLLRRMGMNPAGDQRYAVIAAMTLGDKQYVSRHTRDSFNLSGGAHVLALSGLHLGIIYAVLTLLFPPGHRRRWLGQGLIVAAVWAYTLMVGMGASVVRAAAMLSVFSLSFVLSRSRASLNTLALTAIIMLVSDPLCLWDVGFQMSFMAVTGILLFYRFLSGLVPTRRRLVKGLWGMVAVSLAAQAGTAPLVMYYFGRFSCYFLLTNLIVVPAATLIIYGVMVLLLTMPVPLAGKPVMTALLFIAGGMNKMLDLISSLPGASIGGISLSLAQLVGIYVVLAAIAIFVFYFSRIRAVKKLDSFNVSTDKPTG